MECVPPGIDNNTHAALTYDLMRRIRTIKKKGVSTQLDWCPTIPIMVSAYLPFLIQLTLLIGVLGRYWSHWWLVAWTRDSPSWS